MKKFFSLILAVLMIVSVVPKEVRAVPNAGAAFFMPEKEQEDGIQKD